MTPLCPHSDEQRKGGRCCSWQSGEIFIEIHDKETIDRGLVWFSSRWTALAIGHDWHHITIPGGRKLFTLYSLPLCLASVSRPRGIVCSILSRLDRTLKYPGMPGPALTTGHQDPDTPDVSDITSHDSESVSQVYHSFRQQGSLRKSTRLKQL